MATSLEELSKAPSPLRFSQELHPLARADYLLDITDLKKRAEHNDASAQYLMGQALYYGWNGCVIDKMKSSHYLLLATKQSKTSAGQCASAICLNRAMSDRKKTNYEQFTMLLSNAIKTKYVPAMWEMACSIIKPIDDLHLSEHNFHSDSAYTSTTLTRTESNSTELEHAIELLNKAVLANFVPAITTLSYCYLNGCGVVQNYHESFELARQAATAGNAEGKFYLAYHYAHGLGTTQNEKEAKTWYKAALDQGYELARDYLPKSSCVIM